ncbi:MAG: universal stress protein [Acidobacteriota bacterium]
MISLKRILFPCDFSEASAHARDHAAAIARTYRAELVALHVFPSAPMPLGDFAYLPPPTRLSDDVRARLLGDLKRFMEPAVVTDLPQRVVVVEGDPTWEILAQSKELTPDLMVVGTHGRHGFQRWALGSVTEKLVRRAACPVMTVSPRSEPPAPAGQTRFERILCAIDFSEGSAHALRWALDLATEMGSHLMLLHALEGFVEDEGRLINSAIREYHNAMAGEALEKLKAMVPDDARPFCEIEERVVNGSAYKRILAISESDRSDLIVMGAHGRSALDLLFLGSATHHVVRAAHCPVLTVR